MQKNNQQRQTHLENSQRRQMMDSSSNKDDKSLPHGSSHWDKLPNEIQIMVFNHASPLLTLFLNCRLKVGLDKDDQTIHSLWKEVLDINWPGNLNLIPRRRHQHSSFSLKNADLARVKSVSMYERLCKRFPIATETNTEFAEADEETELYIKSGDSVIPKPFALRIRDPLRLLYVPMRHMWFDVLGDTLDKSPYARVNDCIVEGYTELLRHLVDTGKVDLSCIKRIRMRSHGSINFIDTIDAAAELGHLDILKMFHETGCQEASTKAMDWAAESGHLNIVKWLHENRTEGCTTYAMNFAACCGYLDIVKWLHENRTEGCTTQAMDRAAANGHLDVVEFLHENCTEGCTTNAMDWAAAIGGFATVKWLHQNHTEGGTVRVMDYAAYYGRLDIVKFLHENRTEGCNTYAMDCAAMNGRLDVVKWLHENRSEGFSDKAIRHCKTTEIAEMLIASMSLERRRLMLQKSVSMKWSGPGVDALKKSLEGQDVQCWVV